MLASTVIKEIDQKNYTLNMVVAGFRNHIVFVAQPLVFRDVKI